MSAKPRPQSPSLVRTLTVRLVLATVLAMLLQAGFVAVRDYFYETEFHNSYVRRETARIARIIPSPEVVTSSEQAQWSSYFGSRNADAYAFRILDADGKTIAGQNAGLIALLSPWSEKPTLRQDLWLRKLDPTERMHIAGGVKHRRDGKDYWVELATFGDPDGSYLYNLLLELFDDLWMPMLPLMALTILVATTSVRRQLRPLVAAASRADEISVLERGERLDVTRLPQEASHFASAINRLLDRVADLVAAERLFIARAAHELRTPLSIMMLEIGHLKDPNGKRLEADVRAMSEIVDQLLSLARLETASRPALVPVDVSTIVRELVGRVLDWAEKDGHKLAFDARYEGTVMGDETTIRDSVRNLIENAVKHTPPGTRISIEVTSDPAIVVEDSGPGLGSLTAEELQQPFRKGATTAEGAGLGLAIVKHAVELHGGTLEIGKSSLGGARFAMRFPKHQASA